MAKWFAINHWITFCIFVVVFDRNSVNSMGRSETSICCKTKSWGKQFFLCSLRDFDFLLVLKYCRSLTQILLKLYRNVYIEVSPAPLFRNERLFSRTIETARIFLKLIIHIWTLSSVYTIILLHIGFTFFAIDHSILAWLQT